MKECVLILTVIFLLAFGMLVMKKLDAALETARCSHEDGEEPPSA